MYIETRNVETGFRTLVEGLNESICRLQQNKSLTSQHFPICKKDTRNGNVWKVTRPLTVTYLQPTERVLFNEGRDANPFFHLYESLWMLAGRQDVASLKYYASKISDFSDDGVTFNGAYGYRWRYAGTPYGIVDQLELLIKHLTDTPNSRRAVLQMWSVENDLIRIDNSKDVCCNLSTKFSIREESSGRFLDMTVFNRSNDIIWGMLGANVVHFSFLQEYVARHLNVEVGVYHQIADDAHIYEWNWYPEKWLSYEVQNAKGSIVSTPLSDMSLFDADLAEFVYLNGSGTTALTGYTHWDNLWINSVAQPMCHAFHMHKQRDYSAALHWINKVLCPAWKLAGLTWILKRKENYEKTTQRQN